MSTGDLIDYFVAALHWLGIIWGGGMVATFILYFVLCAASGAGEGSAEEGDEA